MREREDLNRHSVALAWLLLVGAIYFLGVAAAHMLRIKIPVLFVYYNVPSHGYQDRIISFLAFGWSLFLFTASRDPIKHHELVKTILIAGVAALFGLHVINGTTDFHALSADANPTVFRWESRGLSVYVVALIIFYFLATNKDRRS